MIYLYGDSTPSNLRANFLEFLRDSLDFCVYMLQADSRIQRGRERMDAMRAQATLEVQELETFGKAVVATIKTTPKGATDSPANECATRLASLTGDAVRASINDVNE